MPDLGQYAAFIIAAYVTAFAAIGALAVFILDDDRRQRRTLAALERAGVKRRSAQEAAPSVKPKRKRKS
ncbi:heme exporter protein CcmD [Methyloceanibacter sp.]|jgi:heme exporter protein D|uniref:heme exporter protein CcmD n=1 Tax=Methyloceanibacter sp. TaxID=1965321 RepID=UPI00351B96E7